MCIFTVSDIIYVKTCLIISNDSDLDEYVSHLKFGL